MPHSRKLLSAAARRIATALLAPGLATAALVAVPATSAAAVATPSAHRTGGRIAAPLTRAAASARAVKTHRAVGVTSMTMPTSVTTANPDGSFTLTQTIRPTRAWLDGRWVPLNSTLHIGPHRRLVPRATSADVSLSDGGSGPLFIMAESGYNLGLTWPTSLPQPTVSGSTATYSDVMAGIDLQLTVSDQGSVDTTLVVNNASAAASLAAQAAQGDLNVTETSPGLTAASNPDGSLRWTSNSQADPVFSSPTPQMWDSTPMPSGDATVTNQNGVLVAAGSGTPAVSTATGPGAGAQVGNVSYTSDGTGPNTALITMTPPSMLTASNTQYPVYLDPTFDPNPVGAEASQWTQVESGITGDTSGWHEDDDLQVGDCNDSASGCNGIGTVRSYFRMPVSPDLSGATVSYSKIYMTEQWAATCNTSLAGSVDLYTSGPIRSWNDWANKPTQGAFVKSNTGTYGYPGCPWKPNDVTWNVKSVIQADAKKGNVNDQTFELRTADESNQDQWRQFFSGSENISMTTRYELPPAKPDRSTSPGGACYYSSTNDPVIGHDDVTFEASSFDPTESGLTTTFYIFNSAGTQVVNPAPQVTTLDGGTAQFTLLRDTITGWDPTGEATYHWYTIVTNSSGMPSPQPADECYLTYNPASPPAPTVGLPNPPSAALGSSPGIPVTFQTPNCGTPSVPCPGSYTFQLGVAPPFTVSPSSLDDGTWTDPNNTDPTWSGDIVATQLGAAQLSVSGTAAGGNMSEVATPTVYGTSPSTPYPDGYFSRGQNPDLLMTGTGADPSLWLYPGTGHGTVSQPVNIGSLGTGALTSGNGPSQWIGAQILHGDLTGDLVQDAMAYYPATGGGAILPGNGNTSTLLSGQAIPVRTGELYNSAFNNPVDVVAAGYASQEHTSGVDDLIGIDQGDNNKYELDLWTATCAGCYNGDAYELSLSGPDPNDSNWDNYTLATAQPGCYDGEPSGSCNPEDTVLFALDKTTGTLWETTDPSAPMQDPTSAAAINWQTVTSFGLPATLIGADVNAAGNMEVWTTGDGSSVDSLTVSSGSQESQSSLAHPSDEWPLTDGNLEAQGPGTGTALDNINGSNGNASTSGFSWDSDSYFGTDINLDGASGYLLPAVGTMSSHATPSISLWFKTTNPNGGPLVSMQDSAITSGSTTPGMYNPVLYIGDDGKLCAEWWNSVLHPIISQATVDDGTWHHAVLTDDGSSQILTIDGVAQGSLSGGFTGGTNNPTFGAGYNGDSWPDEPNYGFKDEPDVLYFQGSIADINYTQ